MKVTVGDVKLDKLQKKLVNKALDSNRLSYGPFTQEFEKEWARLHNVKYALFCNSGTSALEVSIHALKVKHGWKDGDEVIMPAQTFIATMNAILHNNLKPVFVDVREETMNINPDLIDDAITDRTKMILPVHLLGQPAEMDRIMEIAKKHNLKVVEDSCETVGARYAGQSVGTFGDFGCFSTYTAHVIISGVGGFVCTNDDELAVMAKGLYNHGRDGIYHSIDSDDEDPIKLIGNRFNFVYSGYSYRATELEGAVGLGHIYRFDKEAIRRNINAEYLTKKIEEYGLNRHLRTIQTVDKAMPVWMIYAFVCKPHVNRDDLVEHLERHEIETRFTMPLLNQPITKKLFGDLSSKYPVATNHYKKAFHIGIHQELNEKHLDYVVEVLNDYFTK